MKRALFLTVALGACTAHAQTDNPAVAAIARNTDSLVVAATAGDLVAVNRLLASGVDVNQRLMDNTALDVARRRAARTFCIAVTTKGSAEHAGALARSGRPAEQPE